MQNRKVVIIDEDARFLSVTKKILIMGGYDPVVVNDVSLALDTVIKEKPDVILVELVMSRKNGFELIDGINRACASRRIPIIAMSTFFKAEFNWLFDLCGIKRWLKKPFQPLDVMWAIENEIAEVGDYLFRDTQDKSQAHSRNQSGQVDCFCTPS